MEIRLPKELISFFVYVFKKIQNVSQDLPTTEVAADGADKSWGVVEDFAISCALEFGCTPRLQ